MITAKDIIKKFFSLDIRKDKQTDLVKLKNNILKYYSKNNNVNLNSEIIEVIEYLKLNPLQVFPYTFFDKHYDEDVEVVYDSVYDLNYVVYNNKRIYFKRSWSTEFIKNMYLFLKVEQDIKSPHRYLTDNFDVNNSYTVIDIGAAEGIFTIDIIDKIHKAYLFEPDIDWIEPLNATFAPWKNKVVIENKFVSNLNKDNHISIDEYFKNIKIDFIKIDVDGAEEKLLLGIEETLNKYSDLKVAICTYHKKNDGDDFFKYFKGKGFNVSFSNGYMIFFYDNEIAPPYLRRGVLRAVK